MAGRLFVLAKDIPRDHRCVGTVNEKQAKGRERYQTRNHAHPTSCQETWKYPFLPPLPSCHSQPP